MRETDRDEDLTDGRENVDEDAGLDLLELQTEGLETLRPVRLVTAPLDLDGEREKLRFEAVDRNDCRLRVGVMPAVERPAPDLRAWTRDREP